MSRRPAPGPKRSSPRPGLRNQALLVLGIIVLAVVAFYTALIVASRIDQVFFPDSQLNLGGALGKIPGVDSGDDNSSIGNGRINILFMGVDARPADGKLGRTDTMFVMSIDTSTKTARAIAMPRDLYVEIPGKNGVFRERVNTAYVYGETQGYTGGGPALAKATVERLLGLKLDYYVIIDFPGFKQVIDLLGGVDVDVSTPLKDYYYSETERLGDYYPCVFDVGTHHMNGSDALCYARSRNTSNDFDRIQRQQRIMYAVLDRVSQLSLLGDPSNVVNLWKRYKNAVKTDMNDLQIPGFARLANGVGTGNLTFMSLAAATTPYTTSEGASVLLPSPAGIKQLVDALLSDNRLSQENAVIEVQNGTDKPGFATQAVGHLTNQGIVKDNLIATNAATNDHAKTEIIDFSGKSYTAQRLANWLGVSKDRIRKSADGDGTLRTNTSSDIVVILGSDAHVEAAALGTTQ